MEINVKNKSNDLILNNNTDNKSNILLKELIKDKKILIDDFNKKIVEKTNLVEEISQYINSIKIKKENDIYEVFSPRHAYNNDQDIVEQKKKEMTLLLSECNNMKDTLRGLEDERKKLQIVLKSISKPATNQMEKVLELQNVERQRIARDLHDHTIQDLTMLIHKVDLTTKYIDHDINLAKLEIYQIIPSIKNIIEDMRDIVFNLRPMQIDDLGIKGALTQLMDSIEMDTSIKVNYEIEDLKNLDQAISLSLFQVIHEFCMNAVKHSKGSYLNLFIKSDKSIVTVQIEDDGIGFYENDNVNKNRHFGMQIAKERLQLLRGSLDINSSLNEGTKIKITIPIK